MWSDAQIMAAQLMSADVQQPTPLGHGGKVATACDKSHGRIPLLSHLLDGSRDLFVDFEYATRAMNKCSEPLEIGVLGLTPEPRAETHG